ncbi:UDP-glucose 4-epimerase GalE [Ancylobacter amanitiformis]|uniref:UDP-glucose 4-epimerase n=1 Tax=Ancylobacter amanitiformis TaxID=217069 RepID=A0ABU0LRW5_9HYPH|nr:UDP-glucose 4-epimerase GalE [Ancylobacter amanitiformis]MDQ0511444.1 UDP-glucose 4-epimerase [Ancylobacter amanitiformis]
MERTGRNVLVTGGAGYIGSHACKTLAAAGYVPVTFDSLVTGWQEAVRFGPFEPGDLSDRARLDEVFARWQPVAVMHFAALSQVGESMSQPGRYWRANVLGTLNLIEAAVAAGCRDIVFSSTCATYGDHDGLLLDEDTPQRPLNAYGASKRAIEDMLRDFGASHGVNAVIFRYFNVAGADPDGEIGEWHRPETHLIPIILEVATGQRAALTIFGEDYATPDGTCIRDYIHVSDLVDAHVLGLRWLEDGRGSRVFCLGSGHGFSVREVVEEARRVTGHAIPVAAAPRRAGDAARLVCGSRRAVEELGWQPQRTDLASMIADAWRSPRGVEEFRLRLPAG